MSQQGSLIPIKVKSIVPSPYHGKDSREIAIGEDSHDYAIKSPCPSYPEHAISEAICYRIATACGLAVPLSARLIFDDGREAFGSRFEGGITQFSLLTMQEREEALISCAPWLSALCALDIFLANDDRHFDNALLRRSAIDGRWTFIAMDFSRSLWAGGFPQKPCYEIATKGSTSVVLTGLKYYNSWDKCRAGIVATSLLSLSSETIAEWISDMPISWRTKKVDTLPVWWQTAARTDRINDLLALL